MPEYLHCSDCGEGIFRLVTRSGRRIRVNGECSPFGDIAMIGKLAIVLRGEGLERARRDGARLRQQHGRTCDATDPQPARRQRGRRKKKARADAGLA